MARLIVYQLHQDKHIINKIIGVPMPEFLRKLPDITDLVDHFASKEPEPGSKEYIAELKRVDDEYYEKFGESFPSMCYAGEPMKKMKKCIKSGKPYDPDEELRKRGINPDDVWY